MPNEQKPRHKRRKRYPIDHGKPVRVTGPGWVYLTRDGQHIQFTADSNPIDHSVLPRLQFPPVDPAG